MKVTQEKLDTSLPIDVTVENPAFLNQASAFTISGLDYDTATSYIEAVESDFASQPVRRTTQLGKAAVEAPEQPQVLTGRRASFAAKLYDLANGTDLYGMLAEKRRNERNLAMATKLGIVSTVNCARHQKAVDKLKALV